MPRTAPSAPPLALVFAVCCAGVALFSVMDAAMKGLSLAIGVYNALLWRALAGTVMGAGAMLALRLPWPGGVALRLHLIRGVVVAFMAFFFFTALTRLPLAEAIALSFVAPLIALFLAALLLKEQVGRAAILASVLGIAGVAVILSARMRGSYDPGALLGVSAVLLSAVLFAWNLILQKQQADVASPVEVAFFQHLVMLAVFGCAAPFLAIVPQVAHLPMVVMAAALAFTSLTCLSWAYARAPAYYLIPVEYTAFVWAAIMGWLAFGERLTVATVIGAGLIVCGCLVAARARPAIAAHVETSIA